MQRILNQVAIWRNRFVAIVIDLFFIPCAWLGAFWLRFDFHSWQKIYITEALFWLPIVMALQLSLFWWFGLYRGVWRFASIPDLIRILKAIAIAVLTLSTLVFLKEIRVMPRSIPILYGFILIGGVAGARTFYRWLKDYRKVFYDCQKVLIIGAGSAAEGLVRDLLRHQKHRYHPVALLDDNPTKFHRDIHGVSVVGTCEQIAFFVEKYSIDLILIAIPSANSSEMRRLVTLCESTAVPYRTLPGVHDLADGKVNINALREVALEDLLGREPVDLDWKSLSSTFQEKIIFVCGGGGSIGSELCRQLAMIGPGHLVIIEHHEFNLYAIEMELRQKFPHLSLTCLLMSITDSVAMQQVFANYRPHIVFHAAAYKHVPLLEAQARAAIYNNVIGTKILAECSAQYGVNKFILISTDKAVNPTNIMGTTKRVAEIFCQNFNDYAPTDFVTVRFGNVLDSAGSVVPLFRKQLAEGGPLTVTHPEITRFFMTIPEASQLIMQASSMGNGGEIFVLDMGEPIKISYLAEQLILLSGKVPNKDIDIVYTGLRPGEKLFEELFYAQEDHRKTLHPKIFLSPSRKADWRYFLTLLEELHAICQTSASERELKQLLCKIVPEYQVEFVAEALLVPDNIRILSLHAQHQ